MHFFKHGIELTAMNLQLMSDFRPQFMDQYESPASIVMRQKPIDDRISHDLVGNVGWLKPCGPRKSFATWTVLARGRFGVPAIRSGPDRPTLATFQRSRLPKRTQIS